MLTVKISRLSLALVLMAPIALAFSSKSQVPISKHVESSSEVWFSSLLKEPSFGMDHESSERQVFLKGHALAFANSLREGSIDNHSVCEAEDPFCAFRSQFQSAMEESLRSKKTRPRRASLVQVRRAVVAMKTSGLVKFSLKDLEDGVRSFESFKPLERVTENLTSSSDCRVPALPLFLAEKAEEYLPIQARRQNALDLYELASRCNEGEHRATAQYRYSLLQIWGGRCDLAVPYLSELAASGQLAYLPRAYYWQSRCEEEIGTPESLEKAEIARNALIAQFPFSMQSLLLRREGEERRRGLVAKEDSIARFRSASRPGLNGAVIAAEALLAVGDVGLARKVLGTIGSESDSTEGEFQLYLAWLYRTAGDSVNQLRTLTVLFRDHPESISRSTLEFYFPKRGVDPEIIHEQGLNEYVVMALIRQESAFNEKARSPAGAVGLMQVMPRTARLLERSRKYRNLYDPSSNIRIGSKYFARLMQLYRGDTELALAAYNAGPRHVDSWLKRYSASDRILFLDLIPFKETREYVASIARNYVWYSLLYGGQSDVLHAESPPFKIFHGI